MNVSSMLEELRKYGIGSRSELDKAMNEFLGVDIGIFTSPNERSGIGERESASA